MPDNYYHLGINCPSLYSSSAPIFRIFSLSYLIILRVKIRAFCFAISPGFSQPLILYKQKYDIIPISE